MQVIATAMLKDGNKIERKADVNRQFIARVPIPVRSKLCNTYNKSHEALLQMGEDPSDTGGYFIVRGIEWIINSIESSVYNKPRVFRNVGHNNEVTRLEIISKPGDSYENSVQLFVKWLTGDQLIFTIDIKPFKEIQIPFYLLFRLLGWPSDKKIVDWIVYEYESDVSNHITNKLQAAFSAKYANFGDVLGMHDRTDILRTLVSKMSNYAHHDMTDEKTVQFVNNKVLNFIDVYLLPHIGVTPESRNEKAIYLTHLIRNVFMVEMKVIRDTDRDTLKNKRAHTAGVSFAKAFKKQFNFMIVRPIKQQFAKDFKATSFSRVDLTQSLKSAINSTDFERGLAQAITTGNKSQISGNRGKKMINRLTSQQLHRKNPLNTISSMRQINASNPIKTKQSARANEMRRVHPSYTGYLCPIQTQDGESVGINKQMAISASICPGSSSTVLKHVLSNDTDVIPLSKITPSMMANNMAPVKVNGHWIGCTAKSYELVNKYRNLRRNKKINSYTTIYWDTNLDEVLFWVDTGRPVRPLLIVYNNINEAKGTGTKSLKDFTQYVKITPKHIRDLADDKITMEDLLDQRIIEYISPGEQENLIIAVDHDKLWKNRHDHLVRYTHCDVPQALLGFAALLCPFGTHAPTARVILSTQQAKQACGWFSLAWPFRIDKKAFLQFHNELPLVRTMANEFIQPSGINVTMAIQIYSGYNQEDSIMINKGAITRGMFDGVHFTMVKCELEKNEQFGNPDISLTDDIKPYASFEKIFDGFPKKWTVLNKNDVVIGKYLKYGKPDSEFKYSDKSKIWSYDEPAIVVNVVTGRNQDGKPFAKVKLMTSGETVIGDKFSQRSGQKGVDGLNMYEDDMMFMENGSSPDIVFNPHSLPSRMTINTLMEVVPAKIGAIKGTTMDGTIFRKTNIRVLQDELEKLGMHRSGKERMYNGMTGRWIDYMIFTGPIYYQRLQKFVSHAMYAVAHGSTDVITFQPLSGKSSDGGLRLGEMEKDVTMSNGTARFLSEKFFDHSDGYITYVCRGCGKVAIVNEKKQIFRCKQCGDNADIAEVDSGWASKLLQQEVQNMSIGMRARLSPYTYER
jgi:DNA-directed RNA polymerase beta subunit